MPKRGQRDKDHQHRNDHSQGPSGRQSPGLGTNEPDHFERDLHPSSTDGQNAGAGSRHDGLQSAYDVKDLNRELPNLTDDELKQLTIVPVGAQLEQGAVYFDLNDPGAGEIKARGDMTAGPENRYVAKQDVDYQLWNALIGVDNPERLGFADEGSTTASRR
jgi:hypothetical protein